MNSVVARSTLVRPRPLATPLNRRRARRYPLKSVIRVACRTRTAGVGANLVVAALGLSETGIHLVLREPVQKGNEVEVTLADASPMGPTRRKARIVWLKTIAENRSHAGLAFDRPLSIGDLERFICRR
jgi:hypothetical protein